MEKPKPSETSVKSTYDSNKKNSYKGEHVVELASLVARNYLFNFNGLALLFPISFKKSFY